LAKKVDVEIEQDEEEFEEFLRDFGDTEEIEKESEPNELYVIYLTEDCVPIFKLFRYLRPYFNENYQVPDNLFIRTIDEMKLPYLETLELFPFIHHSFANVMLEDTKKKNTKS
jgi:hypothetical protein